MSLIQTLILSVVEGITEFLPVSSTGHLILATRLLGISATAVQATFTVAIQLGAIAAVAMLYWRRLLSWRAWQVVGLAFIPTGLIGLLLHRVVKIYFLDNVALVVASLLSGGIVFLVIERWLRRRASGSLTPLIVASENLTWQQALILGLCQSAALIPGVSRSGAVMVGGLLLGMSRVAAVEFSFMLAIPTMLAATLFDVSQSYQLFSYSDFVLLGIGFIGAFVSAWVVVKWLLQYVQRHSLAAFGVYRIILAVVWLAVIGL